MVVRSARKTIARSHGTESMNARCGTLASMHTPIEMPISISVSAEGEEASSGMNRNDVKLTQLVNMATLPVA